MAINKKLLETDFYHVSGKNLDLNTIRKRLAKAANQRMVRLERTTSPVSGETYTFGAYEIAQEYLQGIDRHRFSEGLQLDRDYYDIIREITVLQQFLKSKSSTISGMKDIERQRIKSFEAKGISFANTKEFYDFLNSASVAYLSKHGFTSEQLIELYEQSAEEGAEPDDIQKALDTFRDSEGRKSYKDLQSAFNAIPLKGSENT